METEYGAARERFVVAAERAHARTFRVRVPYENQSDLFLDFALLARDPTRALVHLSGTHGIEGYAGSAVQSALLDAPPTDGPTLLFVHAVNPYGMENYRRANGENVDLNRSFHAGKVENPDYAHFDRYLNPNAPFGLYTGLVRGLIAFWRLGEARARQAVAAGQIDFPHGLFYAGKGRQREVKLLQDVLRTHLKNARAVTVLDFHTGLGPFGGEMLFVDHDREAAATDYFKRAFGRPVSEPDPSRGAYSIHGRLSDSFRAVLSPTQFRYCLQEIGTHPAGKVLRALRRENLEWRFRPAGAPPTDRVRNEMLEAFLPADPGWRETALRLGIERWHQARRALMEDTV